MWELETADIIARCIIGEAGDRRVSDQDRHDTAHSIINRMLAPYFYLVGYIEDGVLVVDSPKSTEEKRVYLTAYEDKSLRLLMYGNNQYRAMGVYGDMSEEFGGNAYKMDDYLASAAARSVWTQSKLIAACLVALFNDGDTMAQIYGRLGINTDESRKAQWKKVADMFHEQFDLLYNAVNDVVHATEKSMKRGINNYEDAFVGKGDYVDFRWIPKKD